MHSIIGLLNLEDPNILVSDVSIDGTVKTVTLETRPSMHSCPVCSFRMHSKGIRKRTVNHPVMQDTYRLVLVLKQRRWKCTNPDCGFEMNDSYNFVQPRKRNTSAADMLVINAFRELSATAAGIAERFHISDTQAINIFDRYVSMDRLPLSDAISVDEVYIDMDKHCQYALVIQDFHTGAPVDMQSRKRTDGN